MPKFAIKVDGREFEAEFPDSIAAVRVTFATYQGARSVVVRAVPKDMSSAAAKLETKRGRKMAITFDEHELKIISKCPEVLRIVADWHEVQQNCADDMGADCHGDELRARELRAEADRIESEY